jgi:hypothetical protein
VPGDAGVGVGWGGGEFNREELSVLADAREPFNAVRR